MMDAKERCSGYPQKDADPGCTLGNMNWLGTDDQARDVLARVIYGFRISVLFGLSLTLPLLVVGVACRRRPGLFRRPRRTSTCSASSRSGRRCRCSISC
ncbi:MAG: hypothetical protein QM811_03250 [Pirellulales bacterium]